MADPVENICSTLPLIFSDAQRTTATHRKLVNSLRSIQDACATKHALKGERAFNDEFKRNFNRILPLKKSEPTSDRIIRFSAAFVQHIQKKDATKRQDMMEDDEDSTTMRFVAFFITHLLRGLEAKEKSVRLRVCQSIAMVMACLGEIDDDLYQALLLGLMKRVRDRETSVRAQAVSALARLQGEDESGEGIQAVLLELLQHDPSAEVRRAVLLNLAQSKITLPYLLERARDLDAINRKYVYSRTLNELGDFRLLSIGKREKLLRWGLRDRDAQVQKAATNMFSMGWIGHANDDILELFERLDVVNSKIAEEAIMRFFKTRPEFMEGIEFNDFIWNNLTAESAFLARTFNEFCYENNQVSHLIEDRMPEVTELAFIIHEYVSKLRNSDEEMRQEVEFIVEQLLMIASTMDYSDEIGRRKMFTILRELLRSSDLGESLTARTVEVIKVITPRETDFCQIILEVISDLHDTIDSITIGENTSIPGTPANESFHSAHSDTSDQTTPRTSPRKHIARTHRKEPESPSVIDTGEERLVKEIIVNMRCLHIVQCLLENISGGLQYNSQLKSILSALIVPSVRSHEAPVRERGLHCLGLCCLLDSVLATENLMLFIHCFHQGHEVLQIEAIHIISDIVMVHADKVLGDRSLSFDQLVKFFIKALSLEDAPEVQANACIGAAKLMLSSVLKDDELLETLIVLYMEPSTSTNLPLRQALSYFLPVYCHSVPENQYRMQKISISALHKLSRIYSELEEEEEMLPPVQIAAQLVDWTDPRKLAAAQEISLKYKTEPKKMLNVDIHLDLALDALHQIVQIGTKDERRALCSILCKLHITNECNSTKLQKVYDMAAEISETKAVTDTIAKNALARFEVSIRKLLEVLAGDPAEAAE
ncbi:Condensin complex subunit 3 [Neolecta irregularis DAH-3]|uniref:Condensin complex subunit 3 n=1 Tax=Neolecta irregularis (strain DAH-3) TaxID=1198029 RepID=A0A1U7LJT1_NEOID|nr:Condensin complex subunit 3 [Neolecta irregularis DAH-3]|eukprot:OLL22915.1 Condensin complex subunit 3 [Neolecta irregularis DAH-3]